MAASYVTMQELRTNLGIGSLYSDATIEEVCQAAEDQVNSFLWFDIIIRYVITSMMIMVS